MSNRICYRRAFVEGERRLEVSFYTTSVEKFLQARMVFESSGLVLRHFKSRTEPYEEDYSKGKTELLRSAVREVASQIGRSSLFFVEDTSLRIDALSTGNLDFPGLEVKEWFPATTFEDLDTRLRDLNRGRRATIMSDIALHVPGLASPLFFSGECHGTVAHTPPDFQENQSCPWLTPRTFNGWFIPEGASKRLGEMSFEESCDYDFRISSLLKLLDRLEELAAALNFSPRSYSRRVETSAAFQPLLFDMAPQTLIVVGPTCAGKTTFGEWARTQREARVIEASGLMRMLGEDIRQPGMSDAALATAVVATQGPDTIARAARKQLQEDSGHARIVTGFRLIEEVEYLKRELPQAKIVLVDATERTRFERQIKRGRGAVARNIGEFRKKDREQEQFGLLRVARDLADIRVENEGTMREFQSQMDRVLNNREGAGVSLHLRPRESSSKNRLYRCLKILAASARRMTCEAIETATAAEGGKRIPANNVNKVLKLAFGLVSRYEPPGEALDYSVTDHGKAYLEAIERRERERGASTPDAKTSKRRTVSRTRVRRKKLSARRRP